MLLEELFLFLFYHFFSSLLFRQQKSYVQLMCRIVLINSDYSFRHNERALIYRIE